MIKLKVVGMEIFYVYDDVCKAVAIAIITKEYPSAIEMEDIFISRDPDKTSRDVELFFNATLTL